MTVNNSWNVELGKAETAAIATTRWTGLLRTLGYTVFIVYLVIGVLILVSGLVTLFSDDATNGATLIGGGILIALLGAIIAAPLLAISSYLAMGAHKSLAEVAHLEQTGRPLSAVGLPTPAVSVAVEPVAVAAPPVTVPPPVTAPPPAPVEAPPAPAASAPPPPAPTASASAPPAPAPAPAPAPPAAPSPPAPAPPAPAAAAAAAPPTIPPTGTPQQGDAPGFYDDPDDPGYVRFWGGSMWTDTRMPRP